MKRSAATIDPITANVIGGALETIAVEMGFRLMRMSHSSLIRESEDFGAAVMDAAGNQIAETPQSTPLQSGPLPGYVRGIRAALERRGEAIEPGDVYIHNDAYGGASHVPDVAFCLPVFHEGVLVGFTGTAAHHVDIGAHTPGSAGIVDAVDAYAEGIQLKGLKIYDKGVKNTTLWAVLADNIRASHLVLGDMEAQIAAARIGAEAFLRLIDRYGLATVQAACTALMDYSERMMRQSIEALPDGRYCAEGAIDGYLDDDDPARRELPIAVAVTVDGQRHHGRFHRYGSTGRRPADKHAAPRHGRLRGLDDAPLDPPGFCGARQDTAQRRADPADPSRGTEGDSGEPHVPRAHDCARLPGDSMRRHDHEGACPGCAGPNFGRRQQPQRRRLQRAAR